MDDTEKEVAKKAQAAAYQKRYQAKYRQQHKRVYITLSPQEYEALAVKAAQENTKLATLAKNMTFAYLQTERLVPESVEAELKELKFLIRNIANNVNQIAHYSHTVNQLVNEQDLLLELKHLEERVKQYTLGKLKP